MNNKAYYEVGSWYQYQYDGTICKMVGVDECKEDDGQETCVMCRGKIVFEKLTGEKFVRCGYTFNPWNFNWVPYFNKIEEPT